MNISNQHIKKYTLGLLLLSTLTIKAQQQLVEITGSIKNSDHQSLSGAHIKVKNTAEETISEANGEFKLRTRVNFPFVILVERNGYETAQIEVLNGQNKISVELNSQTRIIDDVVISASRTEEKTLKSPVSIEKIDIKAIREAPAPSFYETLENVKGVQLLTSSLTLKVPNARGFNSPNNFRFMQLVDGVDVQAATLGVPLGNAIGPTELDIQSLEVTPGAASALYGMNAINGLASLQTKNPFKNEGLSLYFRGGVNHIDDANHGSASTHEIALRYAKKLNDKIAFKINGSYMTGVDWISNTLTDQNPNNLSTANPNFQQLDENNNPAQDLWNKYGDERNNRTTVKATINGKTQIFNVSRTGYLEKDLVDPTVRNIKFDAGLYYKIFNDTELSYTYRYGLLDGTFQRGNKIRLQDATVQNHKVELKGKEFDVKGYISIENTGKSYNLKPLADNMDLTNKSNKDWTNSFQSALQNEINSGADLASAFARARKVADQGRVEPGTAAFENLKNTIIGINNWDHVNAGYPNAPQTGGAWLKQQSKTYNVDATYNLSRYVKYFDLLVGADYRVYSVVPDGNNFVDFGRPVSERNTPLPDGSFGENQLYKKYGAFVQLTKVILDDKLKLNASLRIDRNPLFKTKLNPRFAVVYSPFKQHSFRASYQNGFRFPSIFEALGYVNNGGVRRVGGLNLVNEGQGFLKNSYTLASIDLFNAGVNSSVSSGLTQSEAVQNNKGRLVASNLPELRPEQINSFEIGYRSIINNSKIAIDWDAYYNIYDRFLGQVDVAVPKNGNIETAAGINNMLDKTQQTRFRVFTNSTNKYKSFGSSLGLRYNFYGNYTIATNLSYNNLLSNSTNDIFITAFNTPKWNTNISFGNKEIFKNVGFNIVGKWQTGFDWQSPLANGYIPSYATVDAQISIRFPEIYSNLKIGGTNILNHYYYQYAAGPTLGGLYYIAYTFDLNLKNLNK
ncbi:TonB-dependent receptor [Chryseobacterium soli]|uniref:TonB-dependent receptor n=1 Tax=Chryseobacterium soli TaxID=445961 RepID=UPI00068E2A6D|nr:TonB-dependent receptor [Chryseobacterium soli]